jgi:hypothetical protein
MPAPDSYSHVTCGCAVGASVQGVAAVVVTTAPKRGNFRGNGDLPVRRDMLTAMPHRGWAGQVSGPDDVPRPACGRLRVLRGLGGVPEVRVERSRQVHDLAPVGRGDPA